MNRKLQIRYCVHVLLNVAYYYLFPLELCYHDLLADSNCVPLQKVEERRFTIWKNVHRLTATYMWNKHFPWPLSPVDELCLWSELCGLTSQKLIFIANLMEILNFTCTSYERLLHFVMTTVLCTGRFSLGSNLIPDMFTSTRKEGNIPELQWMSTYVFVFLGGIDST